MIAGWNDDEKIDAALGLLERVAEHRESLDDTALFRALDAVAAAHPERSVQIGGLRQIIAADAIASLGGLL